MDPESPQSLPPADIIPMLFYPSDLHLLPAAIRSHGGAYMLNPPLPQPPFAIAKSGLFDLSREEKFKLHNNSNSIRGYNSALVNGREWWDYTPELDVPDRRLPENEEFTRETMIYFDAAIKLLGECVEALRGEYAEIPEKAKEYGMSTIRYLRYSPDLMLEGKEGEEQTKSVSTVPRIAAHTDHGSLTLMTATPPSGLFIYSADGEAWPAPPINNAVLIIAADCMAHWTNCGILPTPHEVVLPAGAEKQERISLAVFLRPAREVRLSDGFTYGRWVDEKTRVERRCWLVGRGGTKEGP